MSQQLQATVQTQQKTTEASSIKRSMLEHAAVRSALTPVHRETLQRCSGGVECAACREKREGMQRAAVNSTPVNAIPPIVHDVLSSSGQPLDAQTREFMEPRFGHDFSQVRVHTDAMAAESARAVNALAYTVGRDVVFGSGQYAPMTMVGKRLMAHELTHVVQQQSGTVSSRRFLEIAASHDPAEQEAEQTSKLIERGQAFHTQVLGKSLVARQAETSDPPDAGAADIDRISQVECVKRLGGCVNTRSGGIPTAEEISLYNQQCSQETQYRGPEVTPTDEECRTTQAISRPPSPESSTGQTQIAATEACDCQLCFLPLEVFLNMGIPPEEAYLAAVHAYIKWNGHSAGFTRLDGESIGEARVISPEPRLGEPHERCVPAKLRTIPLPTGPQLFHYFLSGSPGSYPLDVVNSLLHCQGANCALTRMRLQHLLLDDRRGLYNLIDDNCETWARNVLSAACLEADSVPQGGYGNFAVRVFQETGVRELYHLGRLILGRTRPMPQP